MATISKWEPYGVALDVTATVASVTRTSATQYTVKFNVSWKTYWDGAETNFGMKASSGGGSAVINAFGNYASSGSGSFTGTYSISGNGSASKSASVTFRNYECDWQGTETSAKTTSISLSFTVPAWTSYTVSYNANGGSGAPGAQTKWKDQALTLSSTKPSRTGHTFKGWATSSGGGVAYAAGGTIAAGTNQNLTLYAVWQAYTYTVSYNANGGSGAPSAQTKTYGVTLKLSTTIPTRTNYSFLGWATSASGGVSYVAGANYTTNANITLYAVWLLNYTKPRISEFGVARCDANGDGSDDGTYAYVYCKWATDRSVSSITMSWGSGSATLPASGTSGTLTEIVGNGGIDTDSTYTFTITVTDSGGSTSASTTLSSKAYPIDVLSSGKGIALGKAAELENRFDVNWDTIIRGNLDLKKGLYIPDWRDVELTPNMFGGNVIYPFFSQANLGRWKSILHIKGWYGGSYDAVQIAFPADTALDRSLCYRVGNDSGWDSWRWLLDTENIYDYVFALGGFRFMHTWLGFYNSYDDAKAATNRKGWIGHDGGTDLTIRNETDGSIALRTKSRGVQVHNTNATFAPISDQNLYLGGGATRWSGVYAVTGTIITSDRNRKTDIKPIDQKYIELFDKLQPVTFKLAGGNHDRTHVGFISQDIEETMKELDISAEEFAAFCRDVKMEKVEVVDDETGEKSEKEVEVKDENGNPVYIYSLRYSEFIALNTRMIQENRRKIAEQQTEIDALKQELAEIKALLKGDQHVTDS